MHNERPRGKLAGLDRPSALGIDGRHYDHFIEYQGDLWERENGETKYKGPVTAEPAPTNVEMFDAWRTSEHYEQLKLEIQYRTLISNWKYRKDNPNHD